MILILTPNHCLESSVFETMISPYTKNIQSIIYVEHPILFGFRSKQEGGEMHYHPYKWMLLLSAGKYFFDHTITPYAKSNKIPTTYVEFTPSWTKKFGKTPLLCIDPDDFGVLGDLSGRTSGDITVIPSPIFLGDAPEHEGRPRKRLHQTSYYIELRKKYNIMMESNDTPLLKKWTFDTENRKPLPKDIKIPSTSFPQSSPERDKYMKYAISIIQKYKKYVLGYFSGKLEDFWCPITPTEARHFLNEFMRERLLYFGPYQDAISCDMEYPFLFHSGISSSLNIGLLLPLDVIHKATSYLTPKNTNIASIEGFVRQVLGWREFSRYVYRKHGKWLRKQNYWSNRTHLNKHWYQGTTQIQPIDDAIHTAQKYGYLHHILRLMVIANVMTIGTIYPTDIYRWFMEFFVDSWDWVMIFNVYSMATYSDGGNFSTKAYISTSNYTMVRATYSSTFPGSNIWDALYWTFIGKNVHKMNKMGRFGPMQKYHYERKSLEEKIEWETTIQKWKRYMYRN